MYKTGIPACDALNELHIQGNITPQIWYKTIVKSDLKHPKPHLLAITILSEIVYWYRPKEDRDPVTGEMKGYSKKFHRDLLQRSYDDLSETYGCSKDMAKDAVVFLEKLGVIYREFRDLTIGNVLCNNIMFLGLNVDRLRDLTYPSGEIPPEGAIKSSRRCAKIPPEPMGEFPRTNTENTKTYISTENTPSIHPAPKAFCESDGLSKDELREKVEDDFYDEKQIPFSYKLDKRMILTAIKILSEWYEHMPERFHRDRQELEKDVFDMLVDCLAEMACADGNQTYKGAVVSYAKVIEQINDVLRRDDSLFEFCNETIDDYVQSALKAEIHDKRKYMKSVIWNSFHTYRVKFESDFARTYP